jgi:hypothetical protein
VQKESLMSQLDAGLDSQQQVSIIAPASSSREVGGCIGISCQAAPREEEEETQGLT